MQSSRLVKTSKWILAKDNALLITHLTLEKTFSLGQKKKFEQLGRGVLLWYELKRYIKNFLVDIVHQIMHFLILAMLLVVPIFPLCSECTLQ